MTTLGDFTATSIDGNDVDLSTYDGQVVLVVNTASQCGLTPQYAGLQQLYDDLGDRGFTVLGFPCDQFGNQEPGTEAEIAQFCETLLRRDVPDVRQDRRQRTRHPPAVRVAQVAEEGRRLVGGKTPGTSPSSSSVATAR